MKHPSGVNWCVLTKREDRLAFVCKRCDGTEFPVVLGLQALTEQGNKFALKHRKCVVAK